MPVATRRVGIASAPRGAVRIEPGVARAIAAAAMLLAGGAGFAATDPVLAAHAVRAAGLGLTRILRGMAVLKLTLAAAAAAGVFWRLGAPVGPVRFGAYLLLLAAMAAGPGLIWEMAHVEAGSALLYGGLFATLAVLWRDPGAAARLEAAIARRRAALARRG